MRQLAGQEENAEYMLVAIFVTLGLCLTSKADADDEHALHLFEKTQLTDKFWTEAPAFADLNRDGRNDIVAGPYWYEGPNFKKRHEFYPATRKFKVKRSDGVEEIIEGYAGALGPGGGSDNHYTQIVDFNADGWPDILTAENLMQGGSKTVSWYENPGTKNKVDALWMKHVVADGVDNQSSTFVDLFGDGQRVMLAMSGGQSGRDGGQVGYFKPDPKNPTERWKFYPISWKVDEFQWYTHGLGYGDVNLDGRLDVLHSDGWWEQPKSLVDHPVWSYHAYPFNLGPGQIKQIGHLQSDPLKIILVSDVTPDGVSRPVAVYGGSQMYVDDVNGDGLPDVITSICAHGYGLAWWEQLKETNDLGPLFRRHMIINKVPSDNKYGVKFTEMQALEWADIDGDGLKDIVTGKRFWSHGKWDPEADAPSVLYWFKQVRHADKSVEFIPYLIDDNSGAGTQISVGDIDGNGRPDIAVANAKGAFVFLQKVRNVSRDAWQQAQPKPLQVGRN